MVFLLKKGTCRCQFIKVKQWKHTIMGSLTNRNLSLFSLSSSIFPNIHKKLTTLVKKQDDLLDVKLRLYGGSEMCEVVAAFFLGKSVESGFTVFKNVCDKQMGRKKYKIYLRVLF